MTIMDYSTSSDDFSSSPSRPLRTRRRKGLWIVLILILIVGIGVAWRTIGNQDKNNSAKTLQTARVEIGTLEELVTSQGKLEPKEYVDVGAQVSGQLEKLYVELGDMVKQGDLIAEIDPQILETRVKANQARLKTLQAQLAEQQAQITFAQQQYDRNKTLIEKDAVSRESVQNSEANLKVARARAASLNAQIEEAQSTLEGDQVNLKFTKIYAPMTGTVVVQSAREGQTLNAVQIAPVIVQLANLNVMTVRAQVAEADVNNIKPDMDVYFTTLGDLKRKWHGKVRQLLPSPEIINEVVLYNVLVDVNNEDGELMTGMTTQMFFVLGEAKDVPVIPLAALGKSVPDQDQDNGKAYMVSVMNNKHITEKIVHVGMMNRTLVEIRSGLSVGDIVVLSAPQASTDSKSSSGPRRMPARL
jgi:macrolide-specific efflux system membrane fusion protein